MQNGRSRNKKKVMENIMYFNNGVGPSLSIGTPLTQEEAEKRALAHNISMRYEILEEVRPVIETLAYNDKYRKLLDEIWVDKVRLDGMIKPEEERVIAKVKGKMLKEKRDPGAFIFPIRCDRDDIMKENRNITMINYTEAEVIGRLVNVLCQVGFTTLSAKFLILEIPVDRDTPIVVGRGFLDIIGGNINILNRIFTTFDRLTRQTFRSDKIRITESDSDDEEDYVIKRNEMGTQIHNSSSYSDIKNTDPLNITERLIPCQRSRNVDTVLKKDLPGCYLCTPKLFLFTAIVRLEIGEGLYHAEELEEEDYGYANVLGLIVVEERRKGNGSQKTVNCMCRFISKIAKKSRVLTDETIHSLSTLVYCRDLDRTTLRELIDSEDRLIPDIPVDDAPRVAA
ncbi:hypothetical protein Tco_1219517 [Tanacetum coccineum]